MYNVIDLRSPSNAIELMVMVMSQYGNGNGNRAHIGIDRSNGNDMSAPVNDLFFRASAYVDVKKVVHLMVWTFEFICFIFIQSKSQPSPIYQWFSPKQIFRVISISRV